MFFLLFLLVFRSSIMSTVQLYTSVLWKFWRSDSDDLLDANAVRGTDLYRSEIILYRVN